jgi:hypothetical protein
MMGTAGTTDHLNTVQARRKHLHAKCGFCVVFDTLWGINGPKTVKMSQKRSKNVQKLIDGQCYRRYPSNSRPIGPLPQGKLSLGGFSFAQGVSG